MKNTFIAIIILFNYFVYSQNNSAFEIEFRGKVFFDSEKDSIKYYKFFGKFDNEITDRLLTAEKQIVLVKYDTILIEEFPIKIGPSKTIFIRNGDKNDRLDIDSGKKLKETIHIQQQDIEELKTIKEFPMRTKKL
ncbi:hypothetical protein ACFQ1Q_02185 [Winogradskyella litorisediminis]|uniref:OstA-like protein n=1 Tax=Winogradskyella litorisediminis TaxID=1156618 RepID=A0ABW3N3C7_9FLAO